MRHLAIVVALLAPAVAAAAPASETHRIGGTALTLQPDAEMSPVGGQLSMWAAYRPGTYYVGGEWSIGSAARGDADFAMTYHALVGVRARTTESTSVLVDGGLGLAQQVSSFHLLQFEGDEGPETKGWAPSGAARAAFVANVTSKMGLALSTDVRSTLDGDAAPALELGLGLVFTN